MARQLVAAGFERGHPDSSIVALITVEQQLQVNEAVDHDLRGRAVVGGAIARADGGQVRGQVVIVLDAIRPGCPDPDVGLGNDRVANLVDELPDGPWRAADPPGRNGHAGPFEDPLHGRLALDAIHLLNAEPGDVEFGPQASFRLEPILVQRIDAVDLAVAVGEVAECPDE